uniref:NADH dehydrogenase subunit 2 n=1 Tax=Obrimoposthia wandeli TaxID=2136291 RepID=A0A7D6C4J8_9PLAT|nr:NADH dehydrogenase subunit 2 [Obrimoposthia wandeli]QLJ92325.1 NADH dehydrogenase subunit 2 [Obrimoposthia wandeli]
MVSLVYFFSLVSLFMCISSHNFLWLCLSLELNLYCVLVLILFWNDNHANPQIISYFVVNILSSLFLYLSIISQIYILFVLGLFLKMGFFPFPWWLISVLSNLKWYGFFLINVVQKVVPIFICIHSGGLHNVFFFLVFFLSYFISLIEMNNSSNRFIVFLGWSSVSVVSLVLFLGVFVSFITALVYFIIYSFLLFMVSVENNNIFNLLLLFSLGGFPPFLGFSLKSVFFLSLSSVNALLLNSCIFFVFFIFIG